MIMTRCQLLLAAMCLHLCLASGAVDSSFEGQHPVASAAGITPTTVVVKLQPVPFVAANDTFAFEWEPGTTQRVVLRVLANDKGSGLTIKALKDVGSRQGRRVFIPATNKRVIIYRVARYTGAAYTEKFAYEVADINSPTPETAYVTVKVGPSGVPPVRGAKPDSYVIRGSAGQTLSRPLNVLLNDIGEQLTILDITPVPLGATLKGTVQISADKKSITYTLDQYRGVPFSEAFRYREKDNSLDPATVTGARVDISIGDLNQPLLAANDVYRFTLREGSKGNTWNLPVLRNDKGLGMFVESFDSKSSGFQGSLRIPTGGQSIVYKLSFEFGYDAASFSESFKYVVKDSTGASAKATVVVRVVPEALVANPDSWSLKLDANGNLGPVILDLFANDTGVILNANVTSFGPPFGDLVWNTSESYYVYSVTAHRGPSFSWDIEYTIENGQGSTDSTTATISVDASGVKLPPLLLNDAYEAEVPPDNTFTFSMRVLTNDWPADTLKLTAVDNIGSPRGVVTVDAVNNWLTYVLGTSGVAVDTKFTDTFRYSAVNGTALAAIYTAEVLITVTIT